MADSTDSYAYDLGDYHWEISATPAANQWFDRGMVWMYGYNHDEAIKCFERAIEVDQKCAMAHWGIAYAIGPNYNRPWEAFTDEERLAITLQVSRCFEKAAATTYTLTNLEQDLIAALRLRYPSKPQQTPPDFVSFNDAYANAMRELQKSYDASLDIRSLFAESLMNRTPWTLWDLTTRKPQLGADTLEAVSVLESSFNNDPKSWNHVGLLHMYIHLMEMSPFPEKALRHGDQLCTVAPGCGHLVHMASHIDVLCGYYSNVVERNSRAVAADEIFLAKRSMKQFYTLYYCHNLHFKVFGAMFLGQYTAAMEAASTLEHLDVDVIRNMADDLEAFVGIKQHVFIRFGRWDDVIAQKPPEDTSLYCTTIAMMHYARGVAFANLGRVEAAEEEIALFKKAKSSVPLSRMLFNNTVADILGIAEEMLMGEYWYAKKNFEKAFAHLRNSVKLDDALPYDEPWGWMQPTRHALGALLLQSKQYDEAEQVYRADLGLGGSTSRASIHPRNVWALHGLHECLAHRNAAETNIIKLELDIALGHASEIITSSCFCRRSQNFLEDSRECCK